MHETLLLYKIKNLTNLAWLVVCNYSSLEVVPTNFITLIPGKAGGERRRSPATFISLTTQWPEPPGMLVQGEPEDGGTGPFCRDSKLGTISPNNCSPCQSLMEAPNCAVNEMKKRMNNNIAVLCLRNPISWRTLLAASCFVYEQETKEIGLDLYVWCGDWYLYIYICIVAEAWS